MEYVLLSRGRTGVGVDFLRVESESELELPQFVDSSALADSSTHIEAGHAAPIRKAVFVH